MSEGIIESDSHFESQTFLTNKSGLKESFESKTGFKETMTRQKSSYTIEDILKKRQTSDNTPTQTQVCFSIHLIIRADIHQVLCISTSF